MINQSLRGGVVALICGVTAGGLSACDDGTAGAPAPSPAASAVLVPIAPADTPPASPWPPPVASGSAGPVDLPLSTGAPRAEIVPMTSGTGPYRSEAFAIIGKAFRLSIACTGKGSISWSYHRESGQEVSCDDLPRNADVVTDEPNAVLSINATAEQRWTFVVTQAEGVEID